LILFIDTEWADVLANELVSLALVSDCGRYEFYAVYDLPTRVEDLNPLIDAFQHRYNTHRPHGALGGKTPKQYLAARQANETTLSHMS